MIGGCCCDGRRAGGCDGRDGSRSGPLSWVTPPFVSEKEEGHFWPNHVFDDSADEDCVFVSGLMQFLAHKPGGAAATLAEAELIRHAAGLQPSGPAGSDDLIRGELALFGWAPAKVKGFTALWAALVPGMSATISGVPTNAPSGSPIRHWLPNYGKGHRLYAERRDATDRVWIIDPEGSVGGGYKGEWCTRADIAAFARDPTRSHTVASRALAIAKRQVTCNGGFLWTLPRKDQGSVRKAALVAGAMVTVTGRVGGGFWGFECNGITRQGTAWYRVSAINGTPLPTPLYGAVGRFG